MFYTKQLWCRAALALLIAASLYCSLVGASLTSVRAQEPQDASRPRRAGEQAAAQAAPTPTPTPEKDSEDVDEDEVLRVETDLTNVLFTAYDKKTKRLITTLHQEDVRILEDGVPQEIFKYANVLLMQ